MIGQTAYEGSRIKVNLTFTMNKVLNRVAKITREMATTSNLDVIGVRLVHHRVINQLLFG
jgi:hypothetical protein